MLVAVKQVANSEKTHESLMMANNHIVVFPDRLSVEKLMRFDSFRRKMSEFYGGPTEFRDVQVRHAVLELVLAYRCDGICIIEPRDQTYMLFFLAREPNGVTMVPGSISAS